MLNKTSAPYNLHTYRTDDGIFLRFFQVSRPDPKNKGKHRDVDFVEFIIPNDPKMRPVKKVDETIARKYPEQFKLWKNRIAGSEVGEDTPIDQWSMINHNQANDLMALGVLTVEALAAVSDAQLQNIGMGARDLQKKAQSYVAAVSGDTDVAHLNQQNQKLVGKVGDQQSQINMLMEEVARLSAASGGAHDDLPTEGNPVADLMKKQKAEQEALDKQEHVDAASNEGDPENDPMSIAPTDGDIDPPIGELKITPSAAVILKEHNIAAHSVLPTGKDGTIIKADAEAAVNEKVGAEQGGTNERISADLTSDIAVGDPTPVNLD